MNASLLKIQLESDSKCGGVILMRMLAIISRDSKNLTQMFEHTEHSVTIVSTHASAVQLLQCNDYEVVICEQAIENEKGSAFDLLKLLRFSQPAIGTPFITFRSSSWRFEMLVDRQTNKISYLLGGQGFLILAPLQHPNASKR